MNGHKLTQLLKIDYPFIQGGMARVATGLFAAQVSNAGALGVIGSGSMEAQHLEAHIADCKAHLEEGRTWAVNLMMMNPHCDDLVDIIIREKVPVVTTGAGSPSAYVERLQAAGCQVWPVIASPLMAKRMARLGVDGLIVEGCEAGGHVGSFTSLALLPQVLAAVDLPVVAAGGIATGAQALAVFAMGAVGIQLGTLLLAAEECPIHDNYRARVLQAKIEDVVTIGRIAGTATQLLKNPMSRAYVKMERSGADWEALERYSLGGLAKAVIEGDQDAGAMMVGQSVGLVQEVKPLAAIFADLMRDTDQAMRRLTNEWEAEGPWKSTDTD